VSFRPPPRDRVHNHAASWSDSSSARRTRPVDDRLRTRTRAGRCAGESAGCRRRRCVERSRSPARPTAAARPAAGPGLSSSAGWPCGPMGTPCRRTAMGFSTSSGSRSRPRPVRRCRTGRWHVWRQGLLAQVVLDHLGRGVRRPCRPPTRCLGGLPAPGPVAARPAAAGGPDPAPVRPPAAGGSSSSAQVDDVDRGLARPACRALRFLLPLLPFSPSSSHTTTRPSRRHGLGRLHDLRRPILVGGNLVLEGPPSSNGPS